SGVEMWQAFKVQPRASLHYTVTISVDAGYPAYSQPPVQSVVTAAPPNPQPGTIGVDTTYAPLAIRGRVTDALTRQPLMGALVQLTQFPDAFARLLATRAARLGTDSSPLDRTWSKADGNYRFLDLPDGSYSLTVTLPPAGLRYGPTSSK